MFTRTKNRSAAWTIAPLVAVVVLGLSMPHTTFAQQVPNKDNECNSDIDIGVMAGTFVGPDILVPVTLTVTGGPARAGTVAAAVWIPQIGYSPDCTSTGPCTASPLGTASYEGNLGGTCAGATASVAAGTDIQDVVFDFGSPGLILGPAATDGTDPAVDVTICTLTFDVLFKDGARLYISEASTPMAVVCDTNGDSMSNMGDLQTSTSGIAFFTPMAVPTMGEVAMVILALLLIGSAWFLLGKRKLPAAQV